MTVPPFLQQKSSFFFKKQSVGIIAKPTMNIKKLIYYFLLIFRYTKFKKVETHTANQATRRSRLRYNEYLMNM